MTTGKTPKSADCSESTTRLTRWQDHRGNGAPKRGMSLTRYHRYDDAKPYLVRAGRALGDSTMFIRFQAGVIDPPNNRLRSIEAVDLEILGGHVVDPIIGAKWYLLLGENDKALAALEGAERLRSPYTSFLEVLDFSALPESARWAAVRKRLGY